MVKQSGIPLYLFLLICLVGGLLFAPVAYGQDEVTANQVNEVAKGLYCPVCPNEPLDTCGTEACQQWRDEIRIMLSEGMNSDEIQDNFYERYGSKVLAKPKAEGMGIVLWFGIPIALLVGGFGLFRYMKQLTNKISPVSAPKTAEPDPEPRITNTGDPYLQKLEDELSKRK